MTRRMTDHGIHWIGAIPSAWSLVTLKSLISIQNGDWGNDPLEIGQSGSVLTCYRKADFTQTGTVESGETLRRLARKPFVRHSDILLEKSGDGDLTPVGAVAIVTAHAPAACSNFLARLRAKESGVEPRFIWRFLSALHASPQIWSMFKQTTGIQNIDMGALSTLEVPCPDFLEQRRIADWLDLQTTRIDKRRQLLAKKRELLIELRKSLVHEKVCKGVNQGTDLPAYKAVRIKDVATINPSTSLPRFGSVEFYPMDAIGVDGGLTAGQFKSVLEAGGYSQFKNGDVLFAKVTPCFENGKSAIAEGLTTKAALATTEVTVLRPNKTISPEFLHYRLKARDFADMGESEMKGAGGLKRVPEKHVANFCIALPSEVQQQTIVDFLDRKKSQINRQITLINQLDDLLKQQRKAIIHEAVTGKIDLSLAPLDSANAD